MGHTVSVSFLIIVIAGKIIIAVNMSVRLLPSYEVTMKKKRPQKLTKSERRQDTQTFCLKTLWGKMENAFERKKYSPLAWMIIKRALLLQY